MHGLVIRAFQSFVCDTYGADVWAEVAQRSGLATTSIEAMLIYDDAVANAVTGATGAILSKSLEAMAEDFGTYLVSHPNCATLRRLLRFGGTTYLDFLRSLDDLSDRARLAVSDLRLPQLELDEEGGGTFTLRARYTHPGAGYVLIGALRALADDYGALALIEHQGRAGMTETLSIEVPELDFSEGRTFLLAAAS